MNLNKYVDDIKNALIVKDDETYLFLTKYPKKFQIQPFLNSEKKWFIMNVITSREFKEIVEDIGIEEQKELITKIDLNLTRWYFDNDKYLIWDKKEDFFGEENIYSMILEDEFQINDNIYFLENNVCKTGLELKNKKIKNKSKIPYFNLDSFTFTEKEVKEEIKKFFYNIDITKIKLKKEFKKLSFEKEMLNTISLNINEIFEDLLKIETEFDLFLKKELKKINSSSDNEKKEISSYIFFNNLKKITTDFVTKYWPNLPKNVQKSFATFLLTSDWLFDFSKAKNEIPLKKEESLGNFYLSMKTKILKKYNEVNKFLQNLNNQIKNYIAIQKDDSLKISETKLVEKNTTEINKRFLTNTTFYLVFAFNKNFAKNRPNVDENLFDEVSDNPNNIKTLYPWDEIFSPTTMHNKPVNVDLAVIYIPIVFKPNESNSKNLSFQSSSFSDGFQKSSNSKTVALTSPEIVNEKPNGLNNLINLFFNGCKRSYQNIHNINNLTKKFKQILDKKNIALDISDNIQENLLEKVSNTLEEDGVFNDVFNSDNEISDNYNSNKLSFSSSVKSLARNKSQIIFFSENYGWELIKKTLIKNFPNEIEQLEVLLGNQVKTLVNLNLKALNDDSQNLTEFINRWSSINHVDKPQQKLDLKGTFFIKDPSKPQQKLINIYNNEDIIKIAIDVLVTLFIKWDEEGLEIEKVFD
ncbi:MAG: hypothetical protein ACRC4M_04910 [Mycoplasma sp.]